MDSYRDVSLSCKTHEFSHIFLSHLLGRDRPRLHPDVQDLRQRPRRRGEEEELLLCHVFSECDLVHRKKEHGDIKEGHVKSLSKGGRSSQILGQEGVSLCQVYETVEI